MYFLLYGKLLWLFRENVFDSLLFKVSEEKIFAIIQSGWNCSKMCSGTHTLGNVYKAHPN